MDKPSQTPRTGLQGPAKVVEQVREGPIHRFRPYPEYKDSRMEWLGQIPEDWEVKPLKFVASFINGFAFKPAEWIDEGVSIIRIENLNRGGEFNCTRRKLPEKYQARQGDLLFGWSGNRGTSFGPFLWWRAGLHYVNQHIFRVVEYQVSKRWLYWTLRAVTHYVEKQAHGIIGMVHITRGELGKIPIPMVDQSQQDTIASFLDRETARIDALVAKKERLIELLQEKRMALITHAITKGLDPKVPMKDSGLEWLGRIPAHSEVMAAGRLVSKIEQGWSPSAEDRPADENEWAVIKLSAVSKGTFRQEEHKALPVDLTGDARYEIRSGDFLLTRANTPDLVGDVCVVRTSRPRLMICDLVYRLSRLNDRVDPAFLCYWFLSRAGRYQIEVDARGSSKSMVKISQGHIRGWRVLLPPVDEQRSIAIFLDRETAKIDSLGAKVREAIGRLKEFRRALISAAVRGKIDVRGVTS